MVSAEMAATRKPSRFSPGEQIRPLITAAHRSGRRPERFHRQALLPCGRCGTVPHPKRIRNAFVVADQDGAGFIDDPVGRSGTTTTGVSPGSGEGSGGTAGLGREGPGRTSARISEAVIVGASGRRDRSAARGGIAPASGGAPAIRPAPRAASRGRFVRSWTTHDGSKRCYPRTFRVTGWPPDEDGPRITWKPPTATRRPRRCPQRARASGGDRKRHQ